MVAVSKWPNASWFHLWKKMVREIQLYEPMFLDVNGHLRPNPRWSLRIGLLCGILQTQFFSHVVLFVFLQVPSQYLFLSFFLFDLSLLILRSLSLSPLFSTRPSAGCTVHSLAHLTQEQKVLHQVLL